MSGGYLPVIMVVFKFLLMVFLLLGVHHNVESRDLGWAAVGALTFLWLAIEWRREAGS